MPIFVILTVVLTAILTVVLTARLLVSQLVGRLSQEELMAQLPTFLPALFDAFGNQSADVRKVCIQLQCMTDTTCENGDAELPLLLIYNLSCLLLK